MLQILLPPASDGGLGDEKIKLTVWLLIVSILILAAGCGMNSKDKLKLYENIESTDLSGETMKTVSLSSTKEALINNFGEPKKIYEIPNPKTAYFVYKDIEFGLKNNEVFRYYFSGNHLTSKGITEGDSRVKVIESYGPNYYERTETGTDIIGYLDKKNRTSIEFSFLENNLAGTILMKIK
jgi:hypothetical protein